MRQIVIGLSVLFLGTLGGGSMAACGGPNANAFTTDGGGTGVCAPGDTRECAGADDSVGGQYCTDGEWSTCETENDAGEIEIQDGSYAPVNSAGTAGSAGKGGSSGKGGSAGSSGSAGEGGSTGKGGSDGKGGSSGKGGSGGKGGSSGSDGEGGSSGKGGSDGKGGSGGYAFVEPEGDETHIRLDLEQGAAETTPVIWRNTPGIAPPADLWVESEGRAVLQVSSIGDRPFVRAGLEVVVIEPSVAYDLIVVRGGDTLVVTLVRADAPDQALIQAEVRSASPESPPRAEIVLPSPAIWRAAVSIEAGE